MINQIKYSASKKANINKCNANKPNNDEITKKGNIIINKDHCPRCGELLVKRHGPYGDFYGCENYSNNNCTYTRKYK